ncbi:DUF3558 family protein [Pseudonocardia sp. HH130629-09]|uniref:DUF3558 family protein n=1 Tax=Pseudonocardia sp. HH130629-09 TaxID=1641402 RepID=UPI0006CB25FA|nr:DUF3558 family protein [Pseudonocardia sp. HH130629-09]ALE86350.1 hypothetical protein XF36_27060 [Pseudonocardia sp. HH130629-09]
MVRLVLVLLVVCGVVVGCGAAGSEGPFPPWPAEIDVANVDPCVAMTPELRQRLGVEGDNPATVPLADGPSRACSWGNFDSGDNYTVQSIQSPAAEVATAGGVIVTVVDGYGVIRIVEQRERSALCELYLDTADTASVRIQAESLGYGEQSPVSADDVCRRAELLAASYLAVARTR